MRWPPPLADCAARRSRPPHRIPVDRARRRARERPAATGRRTVFRPTV